MKDKTSAYYGASIGFTGIILTILVMVLTSCGSFTKLSDADRSHRSKISYEMSKAWNEYSYVIDSLNIEYYKPQNINEKK